MIPAASKLSRNHGILWWNHDRNITMPNGNHGESCKIHMNLTGTYEPTTSSKTKLPSSVMYSCASAQSAAPIHGAADNETPNIRLNFHQRRKTGNVAICTKKRRIRPSRRSPSTLLSQQRTKITTEAPKKLMQFASIPPKMTKGAK